jgi:hypothetical protein
MGPDQNRMTSRLTPAQRGPVPPGSTAPPLPGSQLDGLVPPPWRIVIPAADGTELLVLREEDGRLVATGDESRWDEAARRFVHVMMQWSGGAGINWKNDARKAAI